MVGLFLILSIVACGVILGGIDKRANKNKETEVAILSYPRDFTYAVLAETDNKDTYNLKDGSLELIVRDDSYGDLRAVQILRVPEGPTINTNNKRYYFFGCLYPHTNKIIIEKTGFYNRGSIVGHTGLGPLEAGLCEALH